MADFRKLVLAFAIVAVLTSLATPASAQLVNPPFQCVANAAVPPTVRAEGLTELVGDLTLNCTGGTPTTPGQPVPQVNFQIFLNTIATSRILATQAGGNFNEALLIIDEPNSAPNPARPILNCGAPGAPDNTVSGPGVCQIIAPASPADTYNGTTGRPNVFQGRYAPGLTNSIVFLGVPLDPPGTTTNRTIRITNVRANANNLGLPSTLTSVSAITMNISVSGNTSLSINNPQQIVAFILPGLLTSVGAVRTFIQCNDANGALAAGTGGLGSGGQNGIQLSFRFTEGFASSWKEKNIAQRVANSVNGTTGPFVYFGSPAGVGATFNYPVDLVQNVAGAIYNTESGYMFPPTGASTPVPNPPTSIGTVPVTANINALTSSTTGISGAGIASQGTRLTLTFANVPSGVQLWAPTSAFLVRQNATSFVSGAARLVSTDANGAGPYQPVGTAGFLTQIPLFNNAGSIVYEILFADPFAQELLDIGVAVAYVANPGNNLPTPNQIATVVGGFAPFYTTTAAGQASGTLPHPRFVPGTPSRNIFQVIKCSCNILFPYVVNQDGFDTGIVIANTSQDIYGTTPQTGIVRLHYFGEGAGGSAAPTAQTSQPVPGGRQLIFTLSGGGNYGIDNRGAGFKGYIIAQAEFQWCHAFAYITALGVGAQLQGAGFASEAYLGIILDQASLERTGQLGENKAH
jgi:hypothetical protein